MNVNEVCVEEHCSKCPQICVQVAKIKNVYKHTFAKSANETTEAATTRSRTNSEEVAKTKR